MVRGGAIRWMRLAVAALSVAWAGALPVAHGQDAEGGDAAPAASAAARGYTLGPGDVATVRVYGEDRLTGQYVVEDDGALNLPWVGRVDVRGLTLSEVAVRVADRLRDGFLVNPQVAVEVKSFGSRPVQVLGAVARPGTYFLTGDTDLLELLAMAGGVRSDNKTGTLEVQVKRPVEGQIQLSSASLDRLMGGGEGNQGVQAGDVVVVTKGRVVFVSGQVTRPGELPWREGLTVTQALAAAGGPAASARLRRAWLLRGEERIAIDIKAILRGKAPDLKINAEDQLILDESPI
jgi:polysaccharide export outer membrane protein